MGGVEEGHIEDQYSARLYQMGKHFGGAPELWHVFEHGRAEDQIECPSRDEREVLDVAHNLFLHRVEHLARGGELKLIDRAAIRELGPVIRLGAPIEACDTLPSQSRVCEDVHQAIVLKPAGQGAIGYTWWLRLHDA
eukprot:scaffold26695_cov65-Phaeocystis_antarctica.AAC.1